MIPPNIPPGRIVINDPPSRTLFLERDANGKFTGFVGPVWIKWFGEFIRGLIAVKLIAETAEVDLGFSETSRDTENCGAESALLESSGSRVREPSDPISLFDGAATRGLEDSPLAEALAMFQQDGRPRETSLAELLALFLAEPVPPSDDPYSAAWDGSFRPPTQNAVYDQFVAVLAAAVALVSDTVYGAGWDSVTTIAPSKNAVYDRFQVVAAQITALLGSSAYTASNVSADRSYDANATTIDELADVVGTLIADLQSKGILS